MTDADQPGPKDEDPQEIDLIELGSAADLGDLSLALRAKGCYGVVSREPWHFLAASG